MAIDRDTVCDQWLDALPFEPYPFQEEAILAWFECEGGLLVTAPTGMGKTLIAETAVFEALHTGTRLYYTTPLIALTDQKFREIQERAQDWGFPPDQVGMLTGNHKVNPDAPVLVVVAEILLNHLLEHHGREQSGGDGRDLSDVSAVVMDEFHNFNDRERGVVWELSLGLLPPTTRVLLLSATVGNPVEFVLWLKEQHQRHLRLVRTDERKVPLEYHWVQDQLLTELLASLTDGDEETIKSPALVFCFSRDACWELAERLKGLPLIPRSQRPAIEEVLQDHDLTQGIGRKLEQMLIRGVGVHHAGILPKHKHAVEELFARRLIPLVICTETLAAGINLPARSVVLSTILKGPPKKKTLLPASDAHQMFGRAGRPQFDTQGHVWCVAHDDDVKIERWKEKRDKLLAGGSKDPGVLKALKQLERKQPRRRSTEQYWSEGQFRQLIEAGPAKLASRSMIPYRFLVHLLRHGADLPTVRRFLGKRLESSERVAHFEKQLEAMLQNLAALGHITREDDSDDLMLNPSLEELSAFRSIEPLFGVWLRHQLVRADLNEKTLALEAALPLPWRVVKTCEPPWDLPKGPLQEHELEPLMIQLGVNIAVPEPSPDDDKGPRAFWEEREEAPPTFAEMLAIAFDAELKVPEEPEMQTKWIAGGLHEGGGDFWRFTAARNLGKNEGIVLRHLLRFVLLAGEFHALSGDPDYELIGKRTEESCRAVDEKATELVLARQAEARALLD